MKQVVGIMYQKIIAYSDGSISTELVSEEKMNSELKNKLSNAAVSQRIRQTLEVIDHIRSYELVGKMELNDTILRVVIADAIRETSNNTATKVSSVYDKICRQAGISTADFLQLIKEYISGNDQPLYEHLMNNISSRSKDADIAAINRFFGRDSERSSD